MGGQPRRSKKSASPAQAGEAVPADARLIAIRAQIGANKPFERILMRSTGQQMVLMARHWGYILRVRTRWAGDPDMREYFATRAIKDLRKLGIRLKHIRKFALAKHIEIELHGWKDEDESAKATAKERAKAKPKVDPILEAASEIPWEYLLSAATKSVGRFQSLLISRWFSRRARVTPEVTTEVTPKAPQRVLFVESAPGRIEQVYGFKDEEKRIRAAMNLGEIEDPKDLKALKALKAREGLLFSKTEPYTRLKSKVEAAAWEAIHVTGVDTHQVAWLIDGFYDDENGTKKVARRKFVIDEADQLYDGMIIRGDTDSELPVRYDELADLLSKSKKPPCVVTLNLYYSGARTARELVRRGVYASIGFLDEIDDEFAEHFFQAFYWAWCHDNETIADSFLEAWSTMDGDRMHGTAIVIWLGRSAFSGTATPPAAKAAAKKRTGVR
jgi:hypothetical protein